MWNPRKSTNMFDVVSALAWAGVSEPGGCVCGRSRTIANAVFKGVGGEGGTGEMAFSQVLCSLALAAILTSKGRTEKWNFWMDKGRMFGFQLREKSSFMTLGWLSVFWVEYKLKYCYSLSLFSWEMRLWLCFFGGHNLFLCALIFRQSGSR